MVIGCVRARRAQENLQNFRQFTKLSFCPLPPSKQTLVPAVEFIDEVVSSPCSSSSSSLAFCMQLPPMQKNLVEISHASSAIIDEQPAPSQVVAAHLSLWSHKSLKGSAIASPFSRIIRTIHHHYEQHKHQHYQQLPSSPEQDHQQQLEEARLKTPFGDERYYRGCCIHH